jgi:hypothetical protein
MIRANYKYDVSFSFAEEDNAFVQEVANHLKRRNPNYYYYKEDLVRNWGKDLGRSLSSIYRKQSRLCVVFVSADYRDKVWTNFEFTKAKEKAKRNLIEYILPFKLDNTDLPDISADTTYLSRKELNAEALADAICRKIEEHKQRDGLRIRLYGQLAYYFKKPIYRAALATLVVLTSCALLQDHLTPVEQLAAHLYVQSKKKVKGSVCRDGWYSKSRGSGTCSSHGGVLFKKDSVMPMKTVEESHAEAEEISWLAD